MGIYKIHGSGLSAYTGAPQIYADIEFNAERYGNSPYISAGVSASLNALGGQSFFGYSLNLYAGLDNNEPVLLFSKPSGYPNQWNSGVYSGSADLSSYNLSAESTLKIYLQSNCDCEGGQRKVIRTMSLSVPKYATYYYISYDANGGSGAPTTQAKQEGSPIYIAGAPSTSKYYTITYDPGMGTMDTKTQNRYCNFNSWNTQPSGYGARYDSGELYNIDMSMTLYAVWSNPLVSSTLPVYRDGYALEGWYDEYGTKITPSYEINRDITLTAVWTQLEYYTIDYDSNGGGQAPSSQQKRSDTDITLANTAPSPKQYTVTFIGNGGTIDGQQSVPIYLNCAFSGWLGNNILYPLGGVYSINEDVTMVAQWNDPKIVLPTVPVRPNYTFIGWYTQSGAAIGSNYIVNGNMDMYARWATYIYGYFPDGTWLPIAKAMQFDGEQWQEIEVRYNIESGGSE